MQRGLVGSEMCIRDSYKLGQGVPNKEEQESLPTRNKSKELRKFVKSSCNGRTPGKGINIKAQLDLASNKFAKKIASPQEDNGSLTKAQIIPVKINAPIPQTRGQTPDNTPVSYTHLTLPTILLVQISVVAVSLKKKKKEIHHNSAVADVSIITDTQSHATEAGELTLCS
eukprot:TRINITY_DN19622_c0_g1_i1.p1 TRINITY_DN19622_c0_g1~~TRINITY_DN19622_c0_g1_i1.p1  ORF type:complete len:170 (-),score=40.70 TRINITY_DN19622_c0_g1_i1:13-522(-)